MTEREAHWQEAVVWIVGHLRQLLRLQGADPNKRVALEAVTAAIEETALDSLRHAYAHQLVNTPQLPLQLNDHAIVQLRRERDDFQARLDAARLALLYLVPAAHDLLRGRTDKQRLRQSLAIAHRVLDGDE